MAGGLLYVLVSRKTTVLAEYSTVSGNANLIAVRILDKLPDEPTHAVSYSQGQHMFHCLIASGITFVCMAEESLGRRLPFAFLEDVKDRFLSLYDPVRAHNALAYEYNTEFSRVLQQRMVFFNTDPNADAINRVKGELNEVKNVMVENIEKVLDRGERLELLVDKTDHLQHESLAFKREARRLKHKMWWSSMRMMLMLGGVATLILYLVIAFSCGPLLECVRK